MHICLDVDDTITYAPAFFAELCKRFAEARITIVTFREDLSDTKEYLDSIGLRYDRIIVSTDKEHGRAAGESLQAWKAKCVNHLQPDLFFEDMPEVVSLIDPSILVFLPCDDFIRGWIISQLQSNRTD